MSPLDGYTISNAQVLQACLRIANLRVCVSVCVCFAMYRGSTVSCGVHCAAMRVIYRHGRAKFSLLTFYKGPSARHHGQTAVIPPLSLSVCVTGTSFRKVCGPDTDCVWVREREREKRRKNFGSRGWGGEGKGNSPSIVQLENFTLIRSASPPPPVFSFSPNLSLG